MPVQRFSHIGITVADPERSLRFYRDLLGFRPLSHLSVDDALSARLVGLEPLELHATFLERDGTRIELMHYAAPGDEPDEVPRPMNRRGLTHLAVRVDDLPELLGRLEAAGAEILKDTHVANPDFASEVVFVLDPDGVRIELIQLPGDPNEVLGEPLDP